MDINFIREMFYVCIGTVSILTLLIMRCYTINKNRSNTLKEYELNINANIDQSIPSILDTIIEECFNEYIVLNIAFKDYTYINDELEQKIMKDVGGMVSQRMSPALLAKISLYYNSSVLSDIISEKLYITVMNYVINNNQEKEIDKK